MSNFFLDVRLDASDQKVPPAFPWDCHLLNAGSRWKARSLPSACSIRSI